MIKVGDMVAHELYVHSKGVVVDSSENTKEYIIYYIDGLGNDKFQKTPKERIIKVKDLPEELITKILERYQLHLDQIALDVKKQESKKNILKDLAGFLR